MRRTISGLGLLLIGLMMVVPGCEPSNASAADGGPLKLTLTLINNSGGAIEDIGVEGADRPVAFRDMEAGDRSAVRLKEPHLPEWLEVNWTDSRGDRRVGKVKIWTQLGDSYRGDLTLTITNRHKVELRGR